MKRAIRKHLSDFLAIVAIAVIALLVGGLHPLQPAVLPAGVGAARRQRLRRLPGASSRPRRRSRRARARRSRRRRPGRRDRQGELKDGARVDHDEDQAQVHADLQGRDGAAAPEDRPNDMALELDPGNATAGELPRRAARSRLADAAERQPRRVPRRPRRRHARLPAAAVGGAGAGPRRQRREPRRRRSSASSRSRATRRRSRRRSVTRQRNIRRSIHNFQLLAERARRQGHAAGRFVDSSNEVFQAFATRSGLRETLRELPGALPATNDAR